MRVSRGFRSFSALGFPRCTRRSERRARCLLLALPLLGQAALPAGGQPPAPAAGTSLTEAVALTLAHDPVLAVEQARVRAARGALLAQRAAFDPVVSASVSEIESQDPLSESTSGQQAL